ncbi:hypothetical protein EFM26_10545 [Limosilactobacillus fermentum]|uniref:hypothetical protein n=1 Tax=Limosilactobacillus fermentum TaxID=1613 RepID=UPI0021A4F841|nr:hypothetical protein [Limosilactobacillus fermentum]MCT2918899.1 hypothetical protein [Limosilactobacillus fermentum]
MSRANRPIQNRIGDGRKIAPVIDELKIELVIEEPNSGLLIEQFKVEQLTEGRRIAHLKRRKLKIDFSIFGRIQDLTLAFPSILVAIFPSLGGSKSGLS